MLVLAICMAMLSNGVWAQYLISGNVHNLSNQMVYLTYLNDSLQKQTDSAFTFGGSFMFRGFTKQPTHATLYSADKKLDTDFFFENGATMLAGDVLAGAELTAKGGACTETYNQFKRMDEPFKVLRDSLAWAAYMQRLQGDTVLATITRTYFDNVLFESKLAESEFLLSHTGSPVSAFLLSAFYIHRGNWTKGDSLMLLLDEANRQSKYALYRQKIVTKLRQFEPGNPIIHFSQTDTYGNVFSTTELKGKCYLIEFWASWCAPCRKENPALRKVYAKYKPKGFEIVGVSLDTDRNKWLEAITKDQLPWIQVSDLKGWQNAVAQMYEVMMIPSNFLIDKSGNIIGHSLRAEELGKKLAEIYGK